MESTPACRKRNSAVTPRLPAILAAALLLALASCAADPIASQPSSDAEPTPALALYPTRVTHDALIEGRLINAGRCLLIATRDGTTYGLAWPAERTRWDAETAQIVIDGTSAAVGEDVWIGGGPAAVTAQTVSDPQWEWVQPPRAECLGDEFWIASSLSTEEP